MKPQYYIPILAAGAVAIFLLSKKSSQTKSSTTNLPIDPSTLRKDIDLSTVKVVDPAVVTRKGFIAK